MNKVDKYLINEGKQSIEDVAAYVENEGLGYAIINGMGWREIEDKQLSKLWKKAEDILSDIESILGI